MRKVCARLASDSGPSGTGIVGNPDGRGTVSGGTNKDARSGAVDGSRSRVEGNKGKTLLIVVVAVAIRWVYDVVADGRERRHLGEGDTAVCALVKTVAAASTKVDDLGVLGIDSKSLAHATTGHVASNLEGKFSDGPCVALVRAANDGSIVGVPSGALLTHVDGDEGLLRTYELVYMPVAA